MTREIWKVSQAKRCPYCGGEIVRSITGLWHFDCLKCDRAWKIQPDGSWVALFDAAKTTFTEKDLILMGVIRA
jgi:ribosomal protein L37AE/L43A